VQHLTNWIEIPVKNMKRAVKFYSAILGGVTLNEMELGPILGCFWIPKGTGSACKTRSSRSAAFIAR
jgi:predicted enzyme related to lactoylglutathione lyase